MMMGQPMNQQNTPTQKKKSNWVFPVVFSVFSLGSLALVLLTKGKSEKDPAEVIDLGKEKSKRQTADAEKKKLTPSEMGKKGAKARWEKEQAKEEKEEKEDLEKDE